MARSVITLTTDFGLRDPYLSEMKGVILNICPDATIVDISHQIEKFDIRMGAYILASATQYFPRNSIHVAVVDPGVGTKRRAICLETHHGLFVGPDNGVLSLAAEAGGVERAYEINNRKLMLPKVSNTFHGRDIFAPVAAHLAGETSPSDVGPEIKDMLIPEFAKVIKEKNAIVAEVIYTDDFGNLVTNISRKEVDAIGRSKTLTLEVGDSRLTVDFRKTYGEVKAMKPVALLGSHGFLEISINQGNAAKEFRVKSGSKVRFFRP